MKRRIHTQNGLPMIKSDKGLGIEKEGKE